MRPDDVAPGGSEPHDPRMEMRVSRLEGDMRDVKAILGRLEPMLIRMDARLEATLPHLATKAEVADVKAALADKPSKTYMWGILGVLLTSYACGLAALAVLR